MSRQPIRVAIVGGGLAGTILTNSLLKHPQLHVQLYEANSEFKERGASVGLTVNARRALDRLGLLDMVKRAGGVQVAAYRMVVAEGPDAQKTIRDFDAGVETVHRAALLKELLAPIPKEVINLGKKLASISDNTIHFVDGTSATADLIIGADGIHSNVRKFILGEGHPAIDPIFAGFWDCRAIIPFEVALAKLGPQRIDRNNPRQHMYVGDKVMALHDTIDDGRTICIVAGGTTPSTWDKTQWNRSVTRTWLDESFKSWGQFGTDIIDLCCGTETDIPTFLQWASAATPTLHNGHNLVMIGDAAHATTPWQGSGLGLAIEDTLILSTLLAQCTSINDMPAALEAYDQTMRPRGQQIIESSYKTGTICVGGVGLDAARLAHELAPRWDFIFEWDTDGAIKEAVERFEALKSRHEGLDVRGGNRERI